MVVLPIVSRELRVVARRSSTYWMRVGGGGAVMALGGYFLLIFDRLGSRGMTIGIGAVILNTLARVIFCYACFAGVNGSADSISQEKRDGTLGLLFLTDLKGWDVGLGKLFSAFVSAFYALLAAMPVLAITVMLGGVGGGTIWRLCLALLNALFFAGALGLLTSTLSRNSRKASIAAYGGLGFYVAGLPITSGALKAGGYLAAANICDILNPGHTLAAALEVRTYTAPFWNSLLVTNLNAWAFAALSCWLLPRCWQEKGVSDDIGWRGRWRQWCYGNVSVRKAFREKLISVNPFYWLASRTRMGPALVWLVLVGLAALVFASYGGFGGSAIQILLTLIFLLHVTLKFWTAAEASHHLDEQRHSGALELLLACTPMSPAEIARGQWHALRRQFLLPLGVVICFDLGAIVFVHESSFTAEYQRFAVAVIAAIVVLALDFVSLGWVAMWQAMSQSVAKRGGGVAILQVLFLPWLVFGAFAMMAKIDKFTPSVCLWVIMSLGLDVVLTVRSRRKLLEEFRQLASVRFERLGIMGRLGRLLGEQVRASNRHREPEIYT